MSFGLILDVVIGVVLVYALFSLLCTTIQELIASVLNTRGRMLELALHKFVDNGRPKRAKKVDWLFSRDTADDDEASLASAIYSHPMVQGQSVDGRLPSYLSAETFASVVLDIVGKRSGRELKDDEYVVAAQALGGHFAGLAAQLAPELIVDMRTFSARLQAAYNDAMERVSGWYKREAQFRLLLVGAIVAVGFNVDTFFLARKLATESTLREQAVIAAQNVDRSGQPPAEAQAVLAAIKALNLPIGWPAAQFSERADDGLPSWALMLPGLLLTTLALSLGAPFWFDLLGKLTNIRGAGERPAASNNLSAGAAAASGAASRAGGPDAVEIDRAALLTWDSLTDFEREQLSPDDIIDVQRTLKVPKLTGNLDPATRSAVWRFQRSINRAPDGRLTPALTALLLNQ